MSPAERQKLERIEKSLADALHFVRDLLADSPSKAERGPRPGAVRTAPLEHVRGLKRSEAEEYLQPLKQQDLGEIFVQSGGPQSERKKPKAWLIEQILWRIFDFEHGHEAIRRSGPAET